MSKFKVDEVVIIQSKKRPSFNGQETIIIEPYFDYTNDRQAYRCSIQAERGWAESALRKKKPPQEPSTWEAVQEITNWSPEEVKI